MAWDDDAIIIGSVRHGPVLPVHNPKDTKRWRTPSGNEIALTTEGGYTVYNASLCGHGPTEQHYKTLNFFKMWGRPK